MTKFPSMERCCACAITCGHVHKWQCEYCPKHRKTDNDDKSMNELGKENVELRKEIEGLKKENEKINGMYERRLEKDIAHTKEITDLRTRNERLEEAMQLGKVALVSYQHLKISQGYEHGTLDTIIKKFNDCLSDGKGTV